MEGGPKKPPQFNYKNCVVILTFKLQSPSKYSPFDAIHLFRRFFHCSEKFLNLILMPCSAFAIFCFTSSTSAKLFSLRTFFIQEIKNKIKSLGVILSKKGRVELGVMPFGVKNCWTLSTVWGGMLVNHHDEIGKHIESSKNFTEAIHSLSQ